MEVRHALRVRRHVTLAADYRIATLTVIGSAADRPLLGRAVLEDLNAALAVAERNRALDVLVLRGTETGAFGTGPDLGEMAADPAAATAIAALGQRVAARLAGLGAITVAEIDGPCLGGALELALACDIRVAAGHAGTRLGFPQVGRGAIPCWGGTVRLPRLVGLNRAIDLFLNGCKLSAAQALRRRAGSTRLPAEHRPCGMRPARARNPSRRHETASARKLVRLAARTA